MAGHTITLRDAHGAEYRITIADGRVTVNDIGMTVERLDEAELRVRAEQTDDTRKLVSRPAVAHAVTSGDTQWVFVDGNVFTFEVERAGPRRRASRVAGGSLMAPMPATVRRIEASVGQAVRRGDTLIVLEAMKMELPVRAPADGTVARVNCREGELVQAGQELVELQP